MIEWPALRAALRVEIRQIVRHRGRSLLLVALVGVPVAAIVGGATLLRIVEPTSEEKRTSLMGAASLRVAIAPGHDSLMAALARLPHDARIERVLQGAEQVQVPGRRLRARLLAAAPAALAPGGLAHGHVRLTEGRFPLHPGEVALSPVMLEGLGVSRGDSVALAYGARRVVTGVVVDPEALADPIVVRTPALVEDRVDTQLLVELPAARVSAVAARLHASGLPVTTRSESGDRDATMTAIVFFFGGVGFLEAALVIAAAFAVALRRRQREIGLLASVGATAGTIGSAMVLSAATLGAAGAIAGAGVGLATVAGLQQFLDGWLRRWTGGFETPWLAVLAATALGVLTAVVAALVPVRQCARLPIREALGCRRPVAAAPRGWLVAGLGMAALAFMLVMLLPRADGLLGGLAVIGGSVLGVLGFGACSPWVLGGLARGATALPIAWRLAVRDAGRFAARNGPVVTAVLAGMSLGITVAVLVTSVESRLDTFPQAYRDDQLMVEGSAAEETARRIAHDARALAVTPLAAAYAQGMPVRVRVMGDTTRASGTEWVALGDEPLLRALGADAGAAAFARGALLALGGEGDPTRLRIVAGRGGSDLGMQGANRVAVNQRVQGPAYLISNAAAAARGLESGPPPRRTLVPWLVRLPVPVTREALEDAQRIASATAGTSVDAARMHRAPARAIYRLLLIACMLTGLLIVLVATALTAAESAGNEQVLRTVGAAPALLREHLAARASYLALLGCGLAVPAGLLSAMGILGSANIDLGFVMPWRDVLLTVVGLPLLTYGVTWWRAGNSDGMRGARPLVALLVVAALSGEPAHAATPRPALTIRWEPYVGKAVDGSPLHGELGRIRVPERRDRPGGGTIEIAFVRYRTAHPSPGPPLFFLEGGPGAPGVEGCAFIATHARVRTLEQCDVIGIDQRGTGLSRPDLSTPEFRYALPLDRAISRDAEATAFEAAVRRAAAYWRGRGVDLTAYHTEASADDIDDVRHALGIERIVTYGGSYGSHLSLAYLRRHGQHVARAVLAKVEGPDDTWKRPALVQRHLERVDALAAADPAVRDRLPHLLGRVRELLARLERAPVTATARRGQPDSARIVLSAHDLRCALANALGTTRGTAGVPRLLDLLGRGDWSPLADLALPNRRSSIGSMMALLMDCASGMSEPRRAQVRREARDPANLLGDSIHAPFFDTACTACGAAALGSAFRAPFASDVPVLFVSGLLDARTPSDNVEAIRSGFSHAAHVRVTHAGHDSRELLSEEYRDLLQAFLRGELVESIDLTLPFRFEPFEGE